MIPQPSQKGCCDLCHINKRWRGFIGSGSSRRSQTGVISSCNNPQCECHKEAKIRAGAKDFAERFEGVMKELAEEEAPAGDWGKELDLIADVFFPATDSGINASTRLNFFKSVESLLTRAREEEVSSLSGEDGKLFSRVVAKAFEAPFPAVAVQHAIQRVAEKYKKEGREEGARAGRNEIIAALGGRSRAIDELLKPFFDQRGA